MIGKNYRNSKGYTLLELIVAFSIFSLIMLVLYGTFYAELKKNRTRAIQSEMYMESEWTMSRIREEISEHRNLSVEGVDRLFGSAGLLVDGSGGSMSGSLFNIDSMNRTLVDSTGVVVCRHIDRVRFYLGPQIQDGVALVEDVLMICLDLSEGDVRLTLRGGINLVR